MAPRFKWHPFADPRFLEPWLPQLDTLKRNPLKTNGSRFVFRVVNYSGAGFYIKLEEKKGLIQFFRNVFAPKVRSEFNSGKLLEKLKIPCIRYAAWGTCGCSGILVSHELVGFSPLSEIWFSRLLFNPSESRNVIQRLARLIVCFAEHGLRHPDFHMGNLLIDPDTLELAIVDPYGISLKKQDPALLLPCYLEMRGPGIPDSVLIEELARAGLPDAETVFNRAVGFFNEKIEHRWPRRVRSILAGESKFAFCPVPGKWIRNSAWYSPMELPDDMERVVLPTPEAEKIWTQSFHCQLLRQPLDKVPVIFEKKQDFSTIFYTQNKKYMTFYGF